MTTKKMYRMKYRTIAVPFTSSIAHEATKAFLAITDIAQGDNAIEDTLTLTNYLLAKETRALNIPVLVIEDKDAMNAILVSACDIADAINQRGNGYVDVLEDLNLTDNLNPDETPYSVDLGISYLLNALYMNEISYRSFLDKRDFPDVMAGDIVAPDDISGYFSYTCGSVFHVTASDIRCMSDEIVAWIKYSDRLIYGYNILSCQVPFQTVVAKTATFKEV